MLHIKLFLSPISKHVHLSATLFFYLLGVGGKEVIVEEAGNAEQEVGVYRFLIIDLVDVCAAVRQLAGKPGGGLALLFHLLSDKPADVHGLSALRHRFPERQVIGYKVRLAWDI